MVRITPITSFKLRWLPKPFSKNFACLLEATLLMSIGLAARLQAPASTPAPTPELAGIAHAAIRVSDLERVRAFYEKLGFEEAFSMSQGGATTQSFVKVNDRQFIELYPQHQPSDPVGFMHVCFESEDIEVLKSAYQARGLSPTVVRKAGAGNLLFTMVGPENQNLEYTQYIPGSKHTNDRGLHLGASRVAQQIVAVGIEMQDTVAARKFYQEKLAFVSAPALEPGQAWLGLPGPTNQQVEIVEHGPGSAFQLYLGVSDLRRAAAQLKALQIPVEQHKSMIFIRDPDGNRIVFVKSKTA